jgi:hypothetical protein
MGDASPETILESAGKTRDSSGTVKATIHVNAALLDFYRDLSWQARRNLGELIERNHDNSSAKESSRAYTGRE